MNLVKTILTAGVSFSLIFAPVEATKTTTIVNHATDIVTTAIEEIDEPAYSDEDLYWLSRVIFAEAGSDGCSDELQKAVGSVVINRKNHKVYPNTIKDVIFDTHWDVQYGCTTDGHIYWEPNERAIENARYILQYGPTLPPAVMSQGSKPAWGNTYCNIQGVIFSAYNK